MGIVVDLNLQIDGLHIESVDALMDFIEKFNNQCDSIYDVTYDYEVIDEE